MACVRVGEGRWKSVSDGCWRTASPSGESNTLLEGAHSLGVSGRSSDSIMVIVVNARVEYGYGWYEESQSMPDACGFKRHRTC